MPSLEASFVGKPLVVYEHGTRRQIGTITHVTLDDNQIEYVVAVTDPRMKAALRDVA